jgi:hypothetical protein
MLENMRKYIDFSDKEREIWRNCYNEIEQIFKENVKENDEVRINLADLWEEEYAHIRMADPYEDYFEFITSIGCKVEGGDVNITLYFNEDEDYYRRSSFDWDLDSCEDTEALVRVYDAVHDYFVENEDCEDEDEDDNKED